MGLDGFIVEVEVDISPPLSTSSQGSSQPWTAHDRGAVSHKFDPCGTRCYTPLASEGWDGERAHGQIERLLDDAEDALAR